jgi:hypothetical protein
MAYFIEKKAAPKIGAQSTPFLGLRDGRRVTREPNTRSGNYIPF